MLKSKFSFKNGSINQLMYLIRFFFNILKFNENLIVITVVKYFLKLIIGMALRVEYNSIKISMR
jgi:hypothetical protein